MSPVKPVGGNAGKVALDEGDQRKLNLMCDVHWERLKLVLNFLRVGMWLGFMHLVLVLSSGGG